MKKICIGIIALSLGFLTLCQPAFAIKIAPGESLWVQLEAGSTAPSDFDGMTLWWAATSWDSGADLDYILYGPTGYTGPEWPNTGQSPAVVDLSIFADEDVVFEFINASTGSQEITFQDNLFKYTFFDNATPNWDDRVVDQEIDAMFSKSPLTTGNQLFKHDLAGVIDGEDPPAFIRSDFQAAPIPEPGSLLLLSSGLAALAGTRRKFKKK